MENGAVDRKLNIYLPYVLLLSIYPTKVEVSIQVYKETICTQENLYMNVRHNFLMSQKVLPSQISINSWMDKQIMVCPYNGYYSVIKKEYIIDRHSNMDESQCNYTEWKKKAGKKEYTIWFHSYKMLGNVNYSTVIADMCLPGNSWERMEDKGNRRVIRGCE